MTCKEKKSIKILFDKLKYYRFYDNGSTMYSITSSTTTYHFLTYLLPWCTLHDFTPLSWIFCKLCIFKCFVKFCCTWYEVYQPSVNAIVYDAWSHDEPSKSHLLNIPWILHPQQHAVVKSKINKTLPHSLFHLCDRVASVAKYNTVKTKSQKF